MENKENTNTPNPETEAHKTTDKCQDGYCPMGIFTQYDEEGNRKLCGWVWAAFVVVIIGAIGIISSGGDSKKVFKERAEAAKMEESVMKERLNAKVRADMATKAQRTEEAMAAKMAAIEKANNEAKQAKKEVQAKPAEPKLNFVLQGTSYIKVFVDEGHVSHVEIMQPSKDKYSCGDKSKQEYGKKQYQKEKNWKKEKNWNCVPKTTPSCYTPKKSKPECGTRYKDSNKGDSTPREYVALGEYKTMDVCAPKSQITTQGCDWKNKSEQRCGSGTKNWCP